MSQLQITTNNFGNFKLNVIAFSSPIFGSISGVQTKRMKQWYPIKANQPEVEFEVQFVSEKDYETFQDFVRRSQEWALEAPAPMVYLNWPERNINNWSGMITNFVAGGMRFNPAPRAKFVVELVDSFVSKYTEMSSVGAIFERSFGFVMQGFTHLIPNPFQLRLPALTPGETPGSGLSPSTPTNVSPAISPVNPNDGRTNGGSFVRTQP